MDASAAFVGNRVAWSLSGPSSIVTRRADLARATTMQPPAPVVDRSASVGGSGYTFVISTGALDRQGDTVAVDGWKLDAYRKNPVVKWAHADELLPVGRTTAIWSDGRRLKATVEFAEAVSRFARTVREMVDGGFLTGASVGFRPLKYRLSDDKNRPFGIDFLSQELLEWSVVSVPSNPEALLDPGEASKAKALLQQRRFDDLQRIRAGR